MPWSFNLPLKDKTRDLYEFKEAVNDCEVRTCLDSALPHVANFSLSKVGEDNNLLRVNEEFP